MLIACRVVRREPHTHRCEVVAQPRSVGRIRRQPRVPCARGVERHRDRFADAKRVVRGERGRSHPHAARRESPDIEAQRVGRVVEVAAGKGDETAARAGEVHRAREHAVHLAAEPALAQSAQERRFARQGAQPQHPRSPVAVCTTVYLLAISTGTISLPMKRVHT